MCDLIIYEGREGTFDKILSGSSESKLRKMELYSDCNVKTGHFFLQKLKGGKVPWDKYDRNRLNSASLLITSIGNLQNSSEYNDK